MDTMGTQTPSFKKAERRKAWLKLALTGASNSGKTYSALAIASGIGKRIALIDTENRSANYYADEFEFDCHEIEPPFTILKYGQAIKIALDQEYDVLIIDSLSHAWAGEGGLLQQKEELDARGASDNKNKNKYTNWASITKQHERFKSWLLQSNIHLIATMRSKQDYLIGEGGRVQKVGLAPIQREGMEYEFAVVFDIGSDHKAVASKDRTKLFNEQIFQPTRETGLALLNWLNTGSGVLTRQRVAPEKASTTPDPRPSNVKDQESPKGVVEDKNSAGAVSKGESPKLFLQASPVESSNTLGANAASESSVSEAASPQYCDFKEYSIPFGRFKGHLITQIHKGDLKEYVDYLKRDKVNSENVQIKELLFQYEAMTRINSFLMANPS